MREINYSTIFSPNGLLAKGLQYYSPRPQQLDMARAIDESIKRQSSLVIEAATGTGKTFAYLVPALLSGKKILVATASKALQDQLVFHDLPKIISLLGLARTVQNLKGRDNYLCRHRIEEIATNASPEASTYLPEISKIYSQLPKLKTGEKTEISFISQDSPIWYGITAVSEHCLGQKCPKLSDCFMYKARQRAMAAEVVVVNHHLFFADSRLKNDGFGALLPSFEIFIFDEAHQLPEIATQFYSHSFSSAQMSRLLNDLSNLSTTSKEFQQLIVRINQQIEEVQQCLHGINEPIALQKMLQQKRLPLEAWLETFSQLKEWLKIVLVDNDSSDLKLLDRLDQLIVNIEKCMTLNHKGISWIKPLKRHFRVQWSPFVVAEELQQLMGSLSAARIYTSATLRIADGFDWFREAMGLTNTQYLNFVSPFNWHHQALFYIPHGLPDPKDSGYYQSMVQKVVPIINRLGGRTFLLFTSHKALQEVSQALMQRLAFPIYVQGTLEKRLLLDAFRKQGNAVLCGTGSFWEGVDVQGDALSCVIIDKLPFANVSEPWMKAKMQAIEALGQSSFEDYLLPQAIIALKQGVGRLIRTEKDKGLLIMMDPRVIGRQYGETIKKSLPPMRWTRLEEKVLSFINSWSE